MTRSAQHSHARRHRVITPNGRGLGWRPQLPDPRDNLFLFSVSPDVAQNLPESVDLRNQDNPIYDQGELGSCTGNAIAGAMQFDLRCQKDPDAHRVPSRLMIYYNERVIENSVNDDAGAEIRDGIKSVNTLGVCFEDGPDGWPYDVSKFTHKPTQACYDIAKKDLATQYRKVLQNTMQIRGALAMGKPVVFGFTCFAGLDSDHTAQTGMLPMPGPHDQPIGGHAVMLVGYRNKDRRYIVRNSWGQGWGDKGYFYMPFEYVHRSDLATDFWQISLVGTSP